MECVRQVRLLNTDSTGFPLFQARVVVNLFAYTKQKNKRISEWRTHVAA